MVLIGSRSAHFLETFYAVITVANLHAVASAVLLVPSGAASVTWGTSSTSRLAKTFARAQLVVPRYTVAVGTSQAVVVLAGFAWSITLAAQCGWSRRREEEVNESLLSLAEGLFGIHAICTQSECMVMDLFKS